MGNPNPFSGDFRQYQFADAPQSVTLTQIRREVFACAAMHAMLVQPEGDVRTFTFIAQAAFRMADAMLAESDYRRDAGDDVS